MLTARIRGIQLEIEAKDEQERAALFEFYKLGSKFGVDFIGMGDGVHSTVIFMECAPAKRKRSKRK